MILNYDKNNNNWGLGVKGIFSSIKDFLSKKSLEKSIKDEFGKMDLNLNFFD